VEHVPARKFELWNILHLKNLHQLQQRQYYYHYKLTSVNFSLPFISQQHCKICGDIHIEALLPPSVLRFTSQPRSLAASICVLLPKRPIVRETTSAGHAYQLRHLTNGEANQRAELGIKEASFPSSIISSAGQSPDQCIGSVQQNQFIASVQQFTPTLVKLTCQSSQRC
jgi:hypothetical protein